MCVAVPVATVVFPSPQDIVYDVPVEPRMVMDSLSDVVCHTVMKSSVLDEDIDAPDAPDTGNSFDVAFCMSMGSVAAVVAVPFGDGRPVPCWFVAMTLYV